MKTKLIFFLILVNLMMVPLTEAVRKINHTKTSVLVIIELRVFRQIRKDPVTNLHLKTKQTKTPHDKTASIRVIIRTTTMRWKLFLLASQLLHQGQIRLVNRNLQVQKTKGRAVRASRLVPSCNIYNLEWYESVRTFNGIDQSRTRFAFLTNVVFICFVAVNKFCKLFYAN